MKRVNNNNNHMINANKYCNNCGKTGHLLHECVLPIISIGTILFRIKNNVVEYLMIRRKETFGYCDYLKNKSKNYSGAFLKNVIDEMTLREKQLVKAKCNDPLIEQLLDNSETTWTEPEWGFPKGRRNNNEKDLDCGLREFREETGVELRNIQLIENINPYEELFIGSNLKSYKQKYYLAYTHEDLDKLEKYQKSEVSKIGWYNIDECEQLIRTYNVEKLNMIKNIDKTIKMYHLVNLA